MQGARMLRVSCLVLITSAIAAPAAYGADAQSNVGFITIGDGSGSPGGQVNHVSVFVPGPSTYRVFDSSGMTADSGCTPFDANDVDCDPFEVEQVAAFLQGQDDTFGSSVRTPVFVSGGDGNDTLGGGPLNDQMEGDLGNDSLYGGDGNDQLTDGDNFFGTNGTDQFYGQNGNDHLDGGAIADSGAGGDVLDGGAQTDTLTYAQRSQPLTITEDGNSNDGQAGEGDNVTAVEHVILGSKGDKATGDGSPNTLEGRNGNDSLSGGAGNDHLVGANGNDRLTGGGGADVLSGGAGLDKADYSARTKRVTVSIGLGANDGSAGEKDNVLDDVEVVLGGSGSDVLTGEDGANTLVGGAGADHLSGLGGDDVLTGGPGADALAGASGDDVFSARDGAKDHIDCGTGDDRVTVDPIDVVASNCEHVALPGRPE